MSLWILQDHPITRIIYAVVVLAMSGFRGDCPVSSYLRGDILVGLQLE